MESPSGKPGGVGWDWESLQEGWEDREVLPWAGRCCEALLEGQVVSEGPPGGSGGVGSPIRIGEGLEALAKGARSVRSP